MVDKPKRSLNPLTDKRFIKNKPDKELLYTLYITDELSSGDISKMYNCSPDIIRIWLKGYNIILRTNKESHNTKIILINKPNRETLYDLYINKGLVLKDISEIYKCSQSTVREWLKNYNIPLRDCKEAQLKRYEDPEERKKNAERTKKRYEDPLEREKSRVASLKVYEDPKEHEKLRIAQKKVYDDPIEGKRLRKIRSESTTKRFENPLEREKLVESANEYWNDLFEHERHSARMQGQDYDAGGWTGFTDKSRPHLVPVKQCLQLNSWFEGCVRHHIMTGVIIHIPGDLHRSVMHRMSKDDRKEKKYERN